MDIYHAVRNAVLADGIAPSSADEVARRVCAELDTYQGNLSLNGARSWHPTFRNRSGMDLDIAALVRETCANTGIVWKQCLAIGETFVATVARADFLQGNNGRTWKVAWIK